MRVVLTIAGSDSSGGAGVQADLKTMTAIGVYGMTAITALTAQNTMGISGIMEVSPDFVTDQIDTSITDIPPDAVKIGMLPRREHVIRVADAIKRYSLKNTVLDPVLSSTSGRSLTADGALSAMKEYLLPIVSLITPNLPEAEQLTGMKIEDRDAMERAGRFLTSSYGCSVLIKGGHLKGDPWDLLFIDDRIISYPGERIDNPNTHGSGCTLSSAIASYLALGFDMPCAVSKAKEYITRAISAGLDLGRGNGPMDHMLGSRNDILSK
ncbi:bifunctional hydroxymethylpyrimidine kinase/phosphomethylpyrimidine kinase [Butyrivibrio sp. MC2013]|uniref:bifunctional hydroxymethylpyrimidine kinase/phosphomethylpyrimidine kinase n=1 Tax=Butyrivibrio sp. MC2013 TaxID=1280686 RepID=UPI00047BFB21